VFKRETLTKKKEIMRTVTIYTNGISKFTLEDFGKTAGVCHPHNITIDSEVTPLQKRAMHSRGQLHYVFGTGDRKVLSAVSLKRVMKVEGFEIH